MSGGFSQNDNSSHRGQLYLFMGIVTALFLLLAVRLFYFQVISGEEYRAHSERNRIRPVVLEALRGLILDRYGVVLAENSPSYTIDAVPFETSDETVDYLGELTGQDVQAILRRIRDPSVNRFNPIPVQRNVSFDIASQVEEHLLDLPGVFVQITPGRMYGMGTLASHVLGYVSEISRGELDVLADEGYRPGDIIGKLGVEKSFEHHLRGQNGLEFMEVNARGEELGPLPGMPVLLPETGNNVYLTLDTRIQSVAEEAVPDSLAGALVAVEPRTGAVIAIVSRPGYDPNLFTEWIPQETWDTLRNHPLKPLLDRTRDGQYPPASTMKIVTASAALEEELVTPNTVFRSCNRGYQFGNRWAGCWTSGHGSMPFRDAMTHSCDVYFYQVGHLLGLDRWGRYARGFGFGAPSAIDAGVEQAGLVPDADYYDPAQNRVWTPGKILNLAIGQGELLVTPLQMAMMTAAVANGGVLYKPYILDRVESADGETLTTGEPRIRDWLPISLETLRLIQDSMIAVVNEGTARSAQLPYAQLAGKTGTAENPHGLDHSWFIAYAPAEAPRIAVAAVMENAPSGSAVPVVRKVIDAYLSLENRPVAGRIDEGPADYAIP
ncbi:MAG: penicillin-binding protein 2 [Gemmatimonadetes bacterium]|nr:penicillin-binding protein 2 [Gemmatimonadota bacterium]